MKILVRPSTAPIKREFKIVRGRTKLAAVVCWLIDASPLSNTGHIHTFGFENRNDRLARGQIMQMKMHLSTCKRHFPITHHSCALIKTWLRRRLSIKQEKQKASLLSAQLKWGNIQIANLFGISEMCKHSRLFSAPLAARRNNEEDIIF